ncbi:MAG: butyrate kinase [Planctomycetota bacterium]
MPTVLAINPGSTTTKVALFAGGRETAFREIGISPEERTAATLDQLPARRVHVEKFLAGEDVAAGGLDAVVGRGAPLAAVPAGTYRVNARMIADARSDRFVDHVSRLGCLLADALAHPHGISAFIVDPVSVDEFDPVSRVSGLPGLPRRSLTHALNIKAAARRYAAECGRPYPSLNLIISHLGGGISVAVHRGGRMIDAVDANGEGPMSPERSGGLRADDLVDLCFSGKHDRAGLKRLLTRGGGLAGHLDTTDAVEIEKHIAAGNETARLVFEAMAYMTAKHIAGLAAAVAGKVDAVILTGGLARSSFLVDYIRQRVGFLAPLVIYPGENEMLSLALGAERVLAGTEKPRVYPTGGEEA